MSATETILVTGAAGFIGSHVLEKLSAAGLQVIALARRESDLAHALSLKVEIRYGDIRDLASLRQAIQGCTQVIHTAGLASDWASREEFYRTNVIGTTNVVEAARLEGAGAGALCRGALRGFWSDTDGGASGSGRVEARS